MTLRENAELAYQEAQHSGEWEAAARAFFAALPKRRKPRANGKRMTARQLATKGQWPLPVIETTFGDGFTVAMSIWTLDGQPPDVARAARIARTVYRGRFDREPPAISGQCLLDPATVHARHEREPAASFIERVHVLARLNGHGKTYCRCDACKLSAIGGRVDQSEAA